MIRKMENQKGPWKSTNEKGSESNMTKMLSKGLKIIGAMTVAQFTIALIEKKHLKK